jgi:hypothetical protein
MENQREISKRMIEVARQCMAGDSPTEDAESLEEASIVSLDRVPFDGEPDEIANLEKKYGIMIKIVDDSTISLTGDKKRIMKYLTSKDYGLNTREAQELFTFQWYSTPR